MKSFILAISGGMDSIYLLHQLLKEGKKPILAHLNHQVRKKKCDEDEDFLRELAKKHDLVIEVESKDVTKWAKENKKSLEEAGRLLRYEFFEKIRKKHGADEILTAHHLNDNLETVLMNKLRGCSVRGRIGMRTKNRAIRRPLLQTPRSVIESYIKENKLPYREDSTNQDTQYLRNWVRIELVPELLKKNPNLLTDFQKNRKTAIQTYENLQKEVSSWLTKNRTKKSSPHFPISEFQKCDPDFQAFLLSYLYEEAHGSTQGLKQAYIKEGLALIAKNMTGKQTSLGPKLTLRIEYGQVVLESPEQKKPEKNLRAQTSEPKIAMDRVPGGILKTRTWQPGDRFQPSGMKGTKKLQDYFTDTKIPRQERHKIPILTTKEGQIVAVGSRVDERFLSARGCR